MWGSDCKAKTELENTQTKEAATAERTARLVINKYSPISCLWLIVCLYLLAIIVLWQLSHCNRLTTQQQTVVLYFKTDKKIIKGLWLWLKPKNICNLWEGLSSRGHSTQAGLCISYVISVVYTRTDEDEWKLKVVESVNTTFFLFIQCIKQTSEYVHFTAVYAVYSTADQLCGYIPSKDLLCEIVKSAL